MSEAKEQMAKAIAHFQSLEIPVLLPGSREYNKAVATSNLLHRFSIPRCVVRPKTPAHVQAIVKEAKERNILITIKCRGHSYAGHSPAFSGISLDLRDMNTAKIDLDEKVVTVESGCDWGTVYGTLINLGQGGGYDGYVIVGARCPTVGVSGFILGGGLSPFTRSFGMGSDNLLEATLVTSDGELVTVSANDDPKSDKGRLFWALCGAGGGNFGVVVEMKLKVQRLSNYGGTITAGRYQWFPKEGFSKAIMDTMNDFYATPWESQMTIDSTWTCDLRPGKPLEGVRFTVVYDGNRPSYESSIKHNIKHPDLQKQLVRRVLPEQSTRFLHETLASQWFEETERAYPTNKTYELYSSFCFENNTEEGLKNIREATAAIQSLMADFKKDFENEQVNFLVTWIHSGGKATERKPNETAYYWRDAVFHTYVTIEWVDKWMEFEMRKFLDKVKTKLRPLSLNGEAAYINFPDQNLDDFGTKYYGENWEQLREVKKIWDKDNFFEFEQSVWPAFEKASTEGVEFNSAGFTREFSSEGFTVIDSKKPVTDRLASQQWEFYRALAVAGDVDEGYSTEREESDVI